MSLDRFLSTAQIKDVEKILEGYFKALDFIMAEIYNLEMPFVDDAVDIK